MKCQKCGFVSFDYLAECRRCGTDLAPVRERLGFSALKSEVPFLLGSLLKGGGLAETARVGMGARSGEGSQLNQESEYSFDLEAPTPDLAFPSEIEKEQARQEKEELIIELSDEDLESLSADPEPPGPKSTR